MSTKVLYLTTREVAALVRVNPSTVRRWAEKGTLRYAAKLPGGNYRFDREDIDALLSPTTPNAPPPDDPFAGPGGGAPFIEEVA